MAVDYYLENKYTEDEIAKLFKVTRQTFIRWLKRHNDDNLIRQNRKAVSYKVKQKHVNYALKRMLLKVGLVNLNIILLLKIMQCLMKN